MSFRPLDGNLPLAEKQQAEAPATLTALIVDDEKLARDELAFLLQSFPELEVIGTASNGLEALERIEAGSPDLVFMDVHMPGLDGLGAVRKMIAAGGDLPHFVFATAYDQYAVEAFEVNAVDYLLKPIDKERLAVSIERARKKSETPQPLEKLLAQMKGRVSPPRTKLLVQSNNRMLLVDAEEVIYAVTREGLIHVVSTPVEGRSNYKTIEELHSNLDSTGFWRPHRSYLVNIDKIKEVIPWFKSTYRLRMSDKSQTEVPVSRAQTKRLRELFKL